MIAGLRAVQELMRERSPSPALKSLRSDALAESSAPLYLTSCSTPPRLPGSSDLT